MTICATPGMLHRGRDESPRPPANSLRRAGSSLKIFPISFRRTPNVELENTEARGRSLEPASQTPEASRIRRKLTCSPRSRSPCFLMLTLLPLADDFDSNSDNIVLSRRMQRQTRTSKIRLEALSVLCNSFAACFDSINFEVKYIFHKSLYSTRCSVR